MKKIIFIVFIFISQLVFGLNLKDVNLYRSFEKSELILLINLLEKEQIQKDNNDLLLYINMAKEVLSEKNLNEFSFSGSNDLSKSEYLNQSRTYNNNRLLLNVLKTLNIFVHVDSSDGYLKTLDGRKVGLENDTFLILDSLSKKDAYHIVSNEYSTAEIYERSIANHDFNKFTLGNGKVPFVYISSLQKQVYFNNIDTLSNKELIFLFYELFPVSKLKNFRDWYEFGFTSIKRELTNLYKKQISLISSNLN